MHITVNGQKLECDSPITVIETLARLGYTDHFLAVAVNHTCIRRDEYGTYQLSDGDLVEILAPMAGG